MKTKSFFPFGAIVLCCGLALPAVAQTADERALVEYLRSLVEAQQAGASQRHIYINGKHLSGRELALIEQMENAAGNGQRLPDGSYWYDARSGAWGVEGHEAIGIMMPQLPLGGELSPRASNGNTGVFVNGRELNFADVQTLGQCTPVYRGRFWIDHRGFGGVEGGPAQFHLPSLCAQARAGGQGAVSGTNRFGWVGGDDTITGAIFSDGTGVTCGPDGGCIY
jgi:hypothetical protein